MKSAMTRHDVIDVILQLQKARSPSEREAAVGRANTVAPHGRIIDLIYYCERDRTHEEIADEVMLRERLWAEGGDLLLVEHIRRQMLEALSNPSVPETHYTKISAKMLLEGLPR